MANYCWPLPLPTKVENNSDMFWSELRSEFGGPGGNNANQGFRVVTCSYVQKCMQWQKWWNSRKIASFWRFELDAKSGPLEAGDFGENRQRAGNNDIKRPGPLGDWRFWRKWRKIASLWRFEFGCQKWPLKGWRFWQKWQFWRNWRFWRKSPGGWTIHFPSERVTVLSENSNRKRLR